jgi:hypothetical protein
VADILSLLYPTVAEPAAAPAAPPPAAAASSLSGDEALARLYPEPTKPPEPPEAIRELRDTPEGKFYDGAKAYSSEPWQGVLEDPSLSPEARAMFIDEVHRIAADMGASQVDVRQIVSEAHAFGKNPPTAEQRVEMRAEASRQLVATYGKDGAQAALDAAKALVQRDLRLGKLLDATGLGDSPRTIMSLAALAQGQRARGRLK